MGKSNDWAKLGLSKDVQDNLDTIGYSGRFGTFTTFENYLNSLDPNVTYVVQKVRSDAGEGSAAYKVAAFHAAPAKSRIVGVVRREDNTFERMKSAYTACTLAGVAVPAEVAAYFNHAEPPVEAIMEVDISSAFNESEDYIDISLTELEKAGFIPTIRIYKGAY
jgi:hypothetical protein